MNRVDSIPETYQRESRSLLQGNVEDRERYSTENRSQVVRIGVFAAVLVSLGLAYGASSFKNAESTIHAQESTSSLDHSLVLSDVDMLGKSKGKERSCDDGHYRDRTLQLAYELPFAALFKDNKGQTKYEASSVIVVDESVYAVCDSSWAISKFSDNLQPFGPGNVQIGQPDRETEDSGYEAIFEDSGTFYVIRESVEVEKHDFHSIIEELEMGSDDYIVKNACQSEFEFEGDSKGFEGAISVHDQADDSLIILGLCEGNHCSESRKNDRGHGRLVAMKKVIANDGSCEWKTNKTIKIPKSAFFLDYSAITMDKNGRVAISSQENSAIWVGQLKGISADGKADINSLEFDEEKGQIFDFPKNDQCVTVYCNIEGIHWINEEMLIAVSDKMKGKGRQDYRCFEKDQSVHVFVLP